jgi:two-component system chemotaxis response regulator CheY
MRKCLLIEDSSVVRKVVRALLGSMRVVVVEAATGGEAIERFRAEQPDLILLDASMPMAGASEILSALRAATAGKRPFVIYCTTENDPLEIGRAFSAGADDYLLKPFDRAALEQKLSEINALI